MRVDYDGPIVSFERSKGKGLEGGVLLCYHVAEEASFYGGGCSVLRQQEVGYFYFSKHSHPTTYQTKCRSIDRQLDININI